MIFWNLNPKCIVGAPYFVRFFYFWNNKIMGPTVVGKFKNVELQTIHEIITAKKRYLDRSNFIWTYLMRDRQAHAGWLVKKRVTHQWLIMRHSFYIRYNVVWVRKALDWSLLKNRIGSLWIVVQRNLTLFSVTWCFFSLQKYAFRHTTIFMELFRIIFELNSQWQNEERKFKPSGVSCAKKDTRRFLKN